MVVEKYRKIRKRALKLVEKEAPISTALVAKGLKVNWGTAQRTLYELQNEGKIKGKSVSGRNIWVFLKK
jgi:DNA-binding Lrp family transcriptional regulator